MSKTKRPYAEMLARAEAIKQQLQPHCERIEIAGSIRRKCELVGDIEIVCIPKPFETGLFESGFASIVNQWKKIKGEPTGKYTQRIVEGVTLDIFIAERGNWGTILAIRTGSAEYSFKVLACGWKQKGYISEGGYLYKDELKLEFPEEENLFSFLDIPFTKPEARNL